MTNNEDSNKKETFFSKYIKPNIFFITVMMLMTIFFSSFGFSFVKGESMENTLHDKNVLLIKKNSIFFKNSEVKYKVGDVVIAWSDELNEYIIKRVIATGGDTIEIKNNEVYINQDKINEPYIKEDMITGDISQIHIPKGSAFLMGDNRNFSTDSRALGLISNENIHGKLIVRLIGN